MHSLVQLKPANLLLLLLADKHGMKTWKFHCMKGDDSESS